MKEEWKVFIRGVEGRGSEVIKMFEDLGGKFKNDDHLIADKEYLIFTIDHNGYISGVNIQSEMAKIIMDNYTELHLPEQWKDGDIIYSPKFGTFAVYGYNNPTTVYCRVSKIDLVPYPTRALKEDYRLATPKEIELFHELLHKYHKEWDVKKKQLVDWKWIAVIFNENQ